MKSFVFIFFCLFLIPTAVKAQNIADKKFLIINSVMVGTTVYDIESTYLVLDRCETCYELNPIMRPFVEAGRPQLYVIQGLIDAGIIYTSYKMKKQDSKFKKIWWVLPVSVIVVHLVVGTSNMRIAIRF